MRHFIARLLTLLRARRAERELDREIAAHLALLEERFRQRGMTDDAARTAARRALGGVDQTKERHRDARSFGWLEDLRRDIPYSLRGLRRAPGFTAAAITTLALGIGAATAVFSIVNAVLVQPLPYERSGRFVTIAENVAVSGSTGTRPVRRFGVTQDEFLQWRTRTTTLSAIAATDGAGYVTLTTPTGTVRLLRARSSPALLTMADARARLGRVFDDTDERPDADVVILSSRTWQRYFAADPDIVGRTVELGARPYSVVGVMDEGFRDQNFDVALWTVLAPRPGQGASQFGTMTARLADDVSIEAATIEANQIGNELRPASRGLGVPFNYGVVPPTPSTGSAVSGTGHPSLATTGAKQRFEVIPVKDLLVEPVRPALRALTLAVGILLLLVCANIANLLLARGAARQREIGIRLAIGAGRGRIVRQILTESAVLAVAGGTTGIAVAVVAVRAIKQLSSVDAPIAFQLSWRLINGSLMPRLDDIAVDWTALAFALSVAVTAALVFGLTPALYLSRTSSARAIGAGSATRTGTAGFGRTRLTHGLVVAQIVMATTLLIGSGLLAHSFVKLLRVDVGYDAGNAWAFQVVMPTGTSPTQRWAIVDGLLQRLQRLPGVQAAGFTNVGPFLALTQYDGGLFVPSNKSADEMLADPLRPQTRSVTAGFLPAIGARLLDGRWLDGRDGPGAPLAMLVNRALARRYFGDVSPVGSLVRVQRTPERSETWQIAGVVDDVRQARLDEEPFPIMYFDVRQTLARDGFAASTNHLFGFTTLAVRSAGDPSTLVADARAALRQIDAAAAIEGASTLDDIRSQSLVRPRFYMVVLGVFAGIAGLLAAIGVYAVLAYAVAQRTQEIGVRMALGARRSSVLALVLRQGLTLAVVGITVGLAGAAAGTRYLQTLLFGLTPLDPLTFAAVAALFALVAGLASYLPARRATNVDPMVALRCE